MSSEHLEHILDILKKSGPLPTSAIKIRVMAKMSLFDDQYPSPTFYKHLQKLREEKKIQFNEVDNKRCYFVPKFTHPVLGGLLLDNLNGRINVPLLLAGFENVITEDIDLKRERTHFILVFEYSSIKFCLNIPKKAVPFKIHLSRKKFEKTISEEIVKNFGHRTITLELDVPSMTSYKEDKTGHALIDFVSKNEIIIQNLGSVNPTKTYRSKGLTLRTHVPHYNDATLNLNNDLKDHLRDVVEAIAEVGEDLSVKIPKIIFLGDCKLSVF